MTRTAPGRKHPPLTEDVLVSLPSRQLRAPLATMVGVAEMIATGDMTSEQCRAYAAILVREGRRMTVMVKSALEIQDLETGRRPFDQTPTDLAALIHRAVRAADEDLERPISVDLPGALPLVSADPEAILEVLANFLSNARGFSPAGGMITVAARTMPGMVEVSITDQGVGIEAEALPRLTGKFYRADPRLRPGLGLGLAINERIIEAHGGKIAVRSSGPGKGARFAFTLKSASSDQQAPDVLIVEDDASFASLLKAEFAAQGLTTVRAGDAESAERILASMTPRGIVLDLILPGMQGEVFLAKMAAAHPIPVVVLTLKDLEPADISALESAGAVAVLPKGAGAPEAAVTLIVERLARAAGVA
ncbi:MAG TPA: hybrid sensor histidine kinase/response regulator [Candidatus Baltobacterales bacterium]|nr:hybrid sensor histidine kinase/response regulator [Candidatus Baltobacterales bacterium]